MNNDKKEFWIQCINDYRSSGLSAIKWAEANDISVHTLRNRICEYNKKDKEKSGKVKWTSVISENQLAKEETSKVLKVTVGKGVIEVTPGFDQSTLKSLIEILSEC